jgi:hypothetical protein
MTTLSKIILSAIMLSVVMLTVIMLSVMAAIFYSYSAIPN